MSSLLDQYTTINGGVSDMATVQSVEDINYRDDHIASSINFDLCKSFKTDSRLQRKIDHSIDLEEAYDSKHLDDGFKDDDLEHGVRVTKATIVGHIGNIWKALLAVAIVVNLATLISGAYSNHFVNGVESNIKASDKAQQVNLSHNNNTHEVNNYIMSTVENNNRRITKFTGAHRNSNSMDVDEELQHSSAETTKSSGSFFNNKKAFCVIGSCMAVLAVCISLIIGCISLIMIIFVDGCLNSLAVENSSD